MPDEAFSANPGVKQGLIAERIAPAHRPGANHRAVRRPTAGAGQVAVEIPHLDRFGISQGGYRPNTRAITSSPIPQTIIHRGDIGEAAGYTCVIPPVHDIRGKPPIIRRISIDHPRSVINTKRGFIPETIGAGTDAGKIGDDADFGKINRGAERQTHNLLFIRCAVVPD
ncbi:MAG: hypothetical protein BWY71_01969 [Planctomycetes bacterium ADurb.Bin412]|nr:MAG: hypothetical protein BWY71_01969 [Planctomycetes bacterium ADurb.Bin412]